MEDDASAIIEAASEMRCAATFPSAEEMIGCVSVCVCGCGCGCGCWCVCVGVGVGVCGRGRWIRGVVMRSYVEESVNIRGKHSREVVRVSVRVPVRVGSCSTFWPKGYGRAKSSVSAGQGKG